MLMDVIWVEVVGRCLVGKDGILSHRDNEVLNGLGEVCLADTGWQDARDGKSGFAFVCCLVSGFVLGIGISPWDCGRHRVVRLGGRRLHGAQSCGECFDGAVICSLLRHDLVRCFISAARLASMGRGEKRRPNYRNFRDKV